MSKDAIAVNEAPADYSVAATTRYAVPAGYKQTEAGVIPEDWDVKYLRELVDFANGRPHEGDIESKGRFFLITLDSIGIDGKLKSEHRAIDFMDQSLQRNDIVAILSDLAHGNLLGLCDLIPEDNKYVLNQRVGRLRLKTAANPQYIRLQINRRQDHFKKRGQGTSQRHIYKRDFDALVIPLPSEMEQRTIAAALSDVGALISAQDLLIAKKRAIKTAAMQQLLTGKQRLPGFSGEWEVKRLGDVLDKIIGGGTPSRSNPNYWGNEIPWVTVKDFATFNPRQTQEAITREGLKHSASNLIPKGTLITSTRMALGKAVIYEMDVSINQDLKALFPKQNVNCNYLYYWFEYHAQAIDDLGSGSTVKGISLSDLKAIEFHLVSLDEQTAIATVLSDMDADIAALEARRDKTQAIKQGMMQELLTGRTRLV
jgi:type I restriction enzyme S subunit